MKREHRSGRSRSQLFRAIESLESRLLLSATRYVDINSIGPTHDGASWDTAYLNPQEALAAAVAGDTIRVADGTYKPTSGTTRTISFNLKTGVNLLGGYAGYGAADPDARDIAANATILSGDIGTPGSKTDNSYHVVVSSGMTSTAVLDGFTITAGNANGSSDPTRDGGGMYNSGGSPTVSNCTFSSNSATGEGGGMYNYSSSSALINCAFSANSASGYGGGMYNYSSSSSALTNCTFSGNSASYSGGGICNGSSSPSVLTNCAFSANSARRSGGGMYNSSSSSSALTNCTFSGNSATGEGGGMYNYYSSPTMSNCIIWGNGSSPVYNDSSTPVITYSDIQGGYSGTGNTNADPLFVRTPWTGPDGTFGTADDDYGDLRLRTGSLVLNIGSNAAVPTGITTDLAGNPRIQNGMVDMGAYEGTTSAPAAKILYVDRSAVGTNTGTSWTNAFVSLQSALLTAADGDTIRVADGTYKPTATTERTFTFSLRNSVRVYGGYAGYGAIDPDARDIAGSATVLSGDIGVPGSNIDNSYHVVVSSGMTLTAVLDGFTITAGSANGTSPIYSGGGIYNSGGSPTVSNCTFSGNSADGSAGRGGGMYNNYCSPAVSNCTFSGNSASSGGGMYNYYSSPKLSNCTFSRNLASIGGGIYNYSSPFSRLTNCIIWGNATSPIYNSSSTPVITYSDIQGGYSGTGNINADPLFVRSPWTGPDGTFGTADDDYGDLRLRPGSPVLDIGSNAAVPTGIISDLAGNPRIQNGTVDMGAYEGTASAPAPKTLYVDLTAVGTDTGTSWTNAFVSLQSALAAATDGDTIRVADGIYKPTATTDRNFTFAVKDVVALYGGYAGYGAADPDARDIAANATILSGDIGTPGSKTDNSYHVVVSSGMTSTAVLDGFTITAGNADGNSSPASYGGGMYNLGGAPTLNNCTFSGDFARHNGGGMYNDYSSPGLTNCTFSGNSAWGYGGGMYNDYSSPKLTNCTFSRNSASSYGAGMYNQYSSSPNLTNCVIWSNGSSPIYNNSNSSTPVITYSDIQGGWTGTGNINADPLFVRNPSPGPDNIWGTADDDYGDLRLRITSPCIDAGSNGSVPAGITTDLAGNPRFIDVPGVNDPGAIVDMGAYEYTLPLAASGSRFLLNAVKPSVRISFNGDVSAITLSAGDLLLENLSSAQPIDCSAVATVAYDPATRSATWSFAALLADGNYRATLPAGSVSDAGGNALASDYSFEFFALAGDANHDRTVDITDLGILATNWQGNGKTFSEGDFNYDGIVDISDLGILATSWQKTLAAPSQPVIRPATPVRAPGRSPVVSAQLTATKPRRSVAAEVGI